MSKSVEAVLRYLDQASDQGSGRSVPRDELSAQVRGPKGSALGAPLLSLALEYLVQRGFAEQSLAGYRLTEKGAAFHHARKVQDGTTKVGLAIAVALLLLLLGSAVRCSPRQATDRSTVEPAALPTAGHLDLVPEATTVDPTATAPAVPVELSGGPRFQVGDQVVVVWSGDVSVRRTPGYLNKGAGDVCDVAKPRQTLRIVDGPAHENDLYWWAVLSAKCGGSGWIAQDRHTGDVLLDVP